MTILNTQVTILWNASESGSKRRLGLRIMLRYNDNIIRMLRFYGINI